jgi:hypothetical protein
MRYPNPHETTPIKLSDITGVLLHFKFLQDFSSRLNIEVDRKEHWDVASQWWASESARCLAKLKYNPEFTFHYDGSVAYEGSDQLVRLRLMLEDDGWLWIRLASEP